MFEQIRSPVDMVAGDVNTFNEKKLPEPVAARHMSGLLQAIVRELPAALPVFRDRQSQMKGALEVSIRLPGGPAAANLGRRHPSGGPGSGRV